MKPSSITRLQLKSPEKSALLAQAQAAQVEAKEENASKLCPNASCNSETNHVVFGRGKGCSNNPGNQRMRWIVSKYKCQYFGATRGEKRKLLKKAYDEIVEGGVKFLKQVGSENEWVEVESGLAIQKVGHLLRNRTCYKGKIEESLTKHTTESNTATATFTSASTTRRLRDELLRRAIAQQQTTNLGLSVLPNPTSALLAQQLELERLRVFPLIGRRATMGAAAGSLEALQAIDHEQALLWIIASRGSIFR